LHLETPDTPLMARADAERIRQVLSNLLSNAVKYSPQGGEVRVGVHQEGTEVVVWIRDQGMGISSEALPRLFNKFSRVDNRETREIGGTGLGLALVKEIVEGHQGRVWVESEVGQGSTFFFILPVAE
jgi:signal transduction histidine kinase